MLIIIAQRKSAPRYWKTRILENLGFKCRQSKTPEEIEAIIEKENVCEKIIVILDYYLYIKLKKALKKKAKFIVIASKKIRKRLKIPNIDNQTPTDEILRQIKQQKGK